jgi:hypothetical protein
MKYQFIGNYGDGYSVLVGYGGRDTQGVPNKRKKCVFRNAIFETEDDELAQALKANQYFNVDFHLNENKQKVIDKYGQNEELGKKLEKMKFQQLRSIALKARGELGDPKTLFKFTKVDLINKLLQNPERTEALLYEAERDKN